MNIFEEMFTKSYENFIKANCICKFIGCILFIVALPFMLDYGILLLYDRLVIDNTIEY